jgi:subtilase family serine protease
VSAHSRFRGAGVALVTLLVVVGSIGAVAVERAALAAPVASVHAATGLPVDPSGTVAVAPAYTPAVGVIPLGAVPGGQELGVVVGVASSDPSGLAAYAATVGASGAPLGGPLSAAAADARFGASRSSVDAATSYFRGDGLNVSSNPDGLLLYVDGPASSLERAFDTTLGEFAAPSGPTFFEPTTPATLPSIAPWTGAAGLGNGTGPVPTVTPASQGADAPAATCGGPSAGLTPCIIDEAYDFDPLLANGTIGAGATIGVVDPYSGEEPEDQLASDLSTFTFDAGLPVGTVNYLYPIPTTENLNSTRTNPDWQLEDALDLEWSRASAPGAAIDMVFSPNNGSGLYQAIDWLVASDRVNVISLSWGEPDTGIFNAYGTPCRAGCNASTDGSYAVLSPVLELAAVEGITVVAASGDCGAADGTSGVSTNFPASDPYVTGVGGTDLYVGSGGSYETEVAWSGNASGATPPGCHNQGGSGGGYAPFPRPWWQVGLPSQPATRGVPDVALDAATPVSIIVGGASEGVGGTSVGTPIWAGIAALADQAAGKSLGFLNPLLYELATGPNASSLFHEVTEGSNGYSAGPGWNPVTGEGTPIVGTLVPALAAGTTLSTTNLSVALNASVRFGAAPLTVTFSLDATGGTGTYPLEGVSFGTSNATLSSGWAVYTYEHPGVYSAEGFAIDSGGNASASTPVVIDVGGGWPLEVVLSASAASVSVGETVWLNATVRGGVTPYSYTFDFGDGSSADNLTVPNATHVFEAAGSACAVVVVTDSAHPTDAAASDPVAISIGGAPLPTCPGVVPLGVVGGPRPGSGVAPLRVTFRAEGYGGVGPPYSYAWSLPGGGVSGLENVTVTFASAGTYEIELAVAGASGPAVYANYTVVVAPAPPITPLDIVLLAAGAGVVAVVVAFLVERRGRRVSP